MDTTTFAMQTWEAVTQHIDPISVLLVLAGGFFAKKWLKEIAINDTFKTLIVSTVMITGWVIIQHASGMLTKEDYPKFFLSYCLATSFYELLIKRLVQLSKKGR